jgi:tetratricopeptide (TPR) repeat protein
MRKLLLSFFFLPVLAFSQINCDAYLYMGDSLKYEACTLVQSGPDLYQFDKAFHQKYDEALKICPWWSEAYRAKSTAYLKSGDFLTWKKLIDKAVELDFNLHVGYRAWCRYQFFRDYEGAISDIEELLSRVKYDIGISVNGDYQLRIALATWYSAIGQKEKAVEVFNKFMSEENYLPSKYDYYQLGVTYFQLGNYDMALVAFNKQSDFNEFADNAYYKGQLFKKLNFTTEYLKQKELALQLANEGTRLYDPYTHHENHVYLENILND